ncbi:MAG: hypothetical protein FJZ79_09640 [Chlorobi bacterium]|nr:hypothetical protein [Chlorobiota bacterium]
MAKKKTAEKVAGKAPVMDLSFGCVRIFPEKPGAKANYNLQPEVTVYRLWPFSTIEWVPVEGSYRARAIIQHKKCGDIVAFNSWHGDYSDAKAAIDLLSDSLNGIGSRRIYNVYGETLETHTADIGGGNVVNVTEVLGLIWSMQEASDS